MKQLVVACAMLVVQLLVLWGVSDFIDIPFWRLFIFLQCLWVLNWVVSTTALWILHKLYVRERDATLLHDSFREFKYPTPEGSNESADNYLLRIKNNSELAPETRIDAYGVYCMLLQVTPSGFVCSMFFRSSIQRAMQMLLESSYSIADVRP